MTTLVQAVSGSASTTYGIGTSAIATGTNSTLVAFIGWNTQASGSFVSVPAVSISDSAGNLWKQVGITPAGTASPGIRSAIWAASNAAPVQWVSVGIDGFSAAAGWTVAEFSGMAQVIAFDYSASRTGPGSGSTFSMPFTAAQSDVGFFMGTAQGGTAQTALTSPITGWTQVTAPFYVGSGSSSTMFFPAWTPVPAGAGTVSATFTVASSFAVSTSGIAVSASPPAQYSPFHPLTVLEAGFGASPGNISSSLEYTYAVEGTTWTDISTRVLGSAAEGRISAAHGHQYELQQEESGEMTVYLDNHDGAFTPGNASSPYYPNVTLETPIRLSCWWQGRQYPLWMGYVERWPQMWPEMPQWGFSKITATDAIAVCAAGQMNSALDSDILIDNPYAYLPLNEQYTTANVGATPTFKFLFGTSPYFAPADANGLIALNKAPANQVAGVYADANGQQVNTGLAMNFFGDNGTGTGAENYQSQGTNGGPAMRYVDKGLIAATSSGYTIEFWFVWDGSTSQSIALLTGYGTPSSYWASTTSNGSALVVYIQPSAGIPTLNVGIPGIVAGIASITPSQLPQQCVIVVPSGSAPNVLVYLNGQFASATGNGTAAPVLQAIVAGPGRYSYDCNNTPFYDAFNYSAAKLAVYPYVLSAQRITSHYEAGAAGWQGTSAAQRFGQVLTWAQLGLKRAGYVTSGATGNPEITQMGPAYQLSGSGASDGIFQISQSEGGQYFVKADGAITYLERPAGYNQPVNAVFGDQATAGQVLNYNPDFSHQVNGWTGFGGSLTYSTTFTYGGNGSGLLAPAGGTAVAQAIGSKSTAVAGNVYGGGGWLYSPGGGTLTAGVNFYNGAVLTGSGSYKLVAPAASWMFMQGTATAPAGTTLAAPFFSGGNGTANTLYVSYGFLQQISPQVPYMQDTEFDYDPTFLYNEVTATQVDGPNQLIEYDDRSPASQLAYFRRSALSFQSNVVSQYDVSDITTWSIAQFAQPSLRASVVKVHASANPLTAFPVILSLDIGDIIEVVRTPVGGAQITETGIIERISYEIGARYFYVSYQVSPYSPGNAVLCADTAGFSTPATTTLGW